MREGIVYQVACQRDPGRVRYVGQTVQKLRDRRLNHLHDSRTQGGRRYNSHLCNWLRQHAEHEVVFSEIEQVPETILDDRETYWIKRFREEGHSLTNKSPGGGQPRGWSHSAESKERISQAQRGVKKRPFTEEHRRNLSRAGKGRVQSEETREKIRRSRTGILHTDEARKKISEAQRGVPHSAERVAARVEGIRRSWTPERRAKQSEYSRGESSGMAVLTEGTVRAMRGHRPGRESFVRIA